MDPFELNSFSHWPPLPCQIECRLALAQTPKAYQDHPNFSRGRFGGKMEFTVHHYAGLVVYNTAGFVEKNKDQLQVRLYMLHLADLDVCGVAWPPAYALMSDLECCGRE